MEPKKRKNKITLLERVVKKTTQKKKTSSKRKNNRKKNKKTLKTKLLLTTLYVGLTIFICTLFYVLYCYVTMPDIQTAIKQTRQPSTLIIAENGNDINKFGNIYADIIYPDKLPKNLTNAIIAIEDRRFYSHFGFDIRGFLRASITNLIKRKYVQGASTITQQVTKNIFLTHNKTIKRKVQELILSFWLEHKFTKNQIMALYLNRVYFGSGIYGAEAAANWYFNKNVYQLNTKEAAILAGMLKAPNRYNPIISKEKALTRAKVVLTNMKKYKFLTDEEYNVAINQSINNGQQYRVSGGLHFAQYVYDKVNNHLGERTSDLVVMTTLNQKLQETAEKVLREKIQKSKDKNVNEGAVVIMDKTGAIKAMVGGVNYNNSQFNRVTQALRQPGSAFKPIVYLTALQYGFTPDSIIEDKPITIKKWKPENYDKKYYGKVSLDYALTHSLNVATATLSKELYLKDIAKNAHKMGITTDIQLLPSMVLGSNEVKLLDMATAYTIIANGGKKITPYSINEISTTDGKQLYVRNQAKLKQIFDKKHINDLTSMLEHVINRGTGKKASLPIFTAGKTGTTQNYRDAWFIGWTDKYITAVWVGNDNEKPMKKITGGNLPAEIWHDIMITTIKNMPLQKNDSIHIVNGEDNIAKLIEENNIDNNKPETIEDLLDNIDIN